MKAYCGPSFLTTTLISIDLIIYQYKDPPPTKLMQLLLQKRSTSPLLTGPVQVNNSMGMKEIHRIQDIHHHLQDHNRIKQHPMLELRLQGVSWKNPKLNIKHDTLLTIPTIPHEQEERKRDTEFIFEYCGMIFADHLIKLILKVNYLDMTEKNIAIKYTYFKNKMDNFCLFQIFIVKMQDKRNREINEANT